MNARERYEERMATVVETMNYASRVASKMPNTTLADRKARAEKYTAIMHEWHKARIRWKIIQP